MTSVLSLLVVLPLLGAALSIMLGRRAAHALGVVTSLATLGLATLLAAEVLSGSRIDVVMGGWAADVGILLRLDPLSAVLAVVVSAVVLAVLVASGRHGDEERVTAGPALHLVLLAGVLLAFVTGDLFTLFVAFELTLMASYVLLVGPGRRSGILAAGPYVVTNLLAGALFLLAIGAIYATIGSVNLDVITARWPEVPGPLAAAIAVLLLVVFGVKAAAFPVFAWLPRAYPGAPTVVAALFSGLLTKVGVYALMRTRPIFLSGDGTDGVLLVVACATMVVGVLGALGQRDVRHILSFHIVSQVGYMLLGLALLDLAGVAGAVLYLVHHIIVKTGLFLVGVRIEEIAGSTDLERLGGLARRSPATAAVFAVLALSLAGLPPTSGFVAKFALIQASFGAGQQAAAIVAIGVGLLTLLSMLKIWMGAFWSSPDRTVSSISARQAGIGPAASMAAAAVAVAAFSGPLYGVATDAATALLDPPTPQEVPS